MLNQVFNHIWQSTLFAVVAALLALALRNNHARVRHSIWLTASVKFLIPFSLLVGIGSQFGWRTVPASPRVSLVIEEISQPFTVPSATPPNRSTVPASSRVPAILLAVWACGFIGVVFSWCLQLRRIRAALRAASLLAIPAPIRVLTSPALLEPGVVGIRRPILLLPEGIADRLTPAQLHAVIAHELCHVRRRDNLTALIHMLVEAIFWFHPLVWWMGTRLVEERERACDEDVLRRGAKPEVYAESILKVCQFYLESPVACVSGITGANLKKRIEEIMTPRHTRKLNFVRKALLAAAGIAAVAGPILIGLANAPASRAQSPAGPAAFDVASIKPSKPGVRGYSSRPLSGGRFTAKNIPLRKLIMDAYRMFDFQVSGGPNWLDTYRVDIDAKGDEQSKPEQLRTMIRTLLSDRFHMVSHRETKELPVYALVVGKGGPKMKQSKEEAVPPEFRVFMRKQITAKRAPLEFLTEALAFVMGRPVLDQTGLKGGFDYALEWTPDQSQGKGDDEPLPPDPEHPSIFVALQEQLGLKLESRKGPVDILIIDRIEKATEN